MLMMSDESMTQRSSSSPLRIESEPFDHQLGCGLDKKAGLVKQKKIVHTPLGATSYTIQWPPMRTD
jgi:hypothetical protein